MGEIDLLDALQWPAMVVTLVASWLVAASSRTKRNRGFWAFLASNVLWTAWGWRSGAWALIVLQVGLLALNLRGIKKTEPG